MTICVFCSTEIVAQDGEEFFKILNLSEINLSEKERKQIENVGVKVGVNDKIVVKLNKIEKIFKNQKYVFTLPITQKKIEAVPIRAQYRTDKDYTFFGKIDNKGEFIYTFKDGKTSLFVDYEDYTYEVYPLSDSNENHLFVRHDKKSTANTRYCGSIDTPKKETKDGRRIGYQPCSDSDKLRVMVIYTTNAQNSSSIWYLSQLMIDQFNQGCWNSNIGHVQAELVGPFHWTNYSEVNNINSELNNLRNDSYIQNLRNDNKADLVVLFSRNSSYTPYASKTLNYNQEGDNSFAVCDVSIANTHYGAVHILSHLLSTRHAQCSIEPTDPLCDDNHAYSHSWKFDANPSPSTYDVKNTIAYSAPVSTILYFSNPNVNYNGVATGTSNNNNALRISETFPYVKAYYYGPGTLNAYIGSIGSYDPNATYQVANTTYTLLAGSECGIRPHYYNWEVSSDGVNFTTVSSNSTFSIYLGEWDYRVVRLKVYDSNFDMDYASVTLMSLCSGCRMGNDKDLPSNGQQLLNDDTKPLLVYPNPVKDYLKIALRLKKEGKVKVDIVDLQGKVLGTVTEKSYSSGEHYLEYSLKSEVSGGNYFCKMEVDGAFIDVQKFNVEK